MDPSMNMKAFTSAAGDSSTMYGLAAPSMFANPNMSNSFVGCNNGTPVSLSVSGQTDGVHRNNVTSNMSFSQPKQHQQSSHGDDAPSLFDSLKAADVAQNARPERQVPSLLPPTPSAAPNKPLTFHDLDGILQAAEDVLDEDCARGPGAPVGNNNNNNVHDMLGGYGSGLTVNTNRINGNSNNNYSHFDNGNSAMGTFSANSSSPSPPSSDAKVSANPMSSDEFSSLFDPTPIGPLSRVQVVDEIPLTSFSFAGKSGKNARGNAQMAAVDLLFPSLFKHGSADNSSSNNNNNQQNFDNSQAAKRQKTAGNFSMSSDTVNGMNLQQQQQQQPPAITPGDMFNQPTMGLMGSIPTQTQSNMNNKRSFGQFNQPGFLLDSGMDMSTVMTPATTSSIAASAPSNSSNARSNNLPSSTNSKFRFRSYQSEMWVERLAELEKFRETHGHCLVPHNWKENLPLAQWVKRQRYQYKLKVEGKRSTMTDERQEILEGLGFVWDSHKAAWQERWHELRQFCAANGHTNVPSTYPENPQLSVWVKCQRRQYKLYVKGMKTNLTADRKAQLDSLGFVWNPRNLQTCR